MSVEYGFGVSGADFVCITGMHSMSMKDGLRIKFVVPYRAHSLGKAHWLLPKTCPSYSKLKDREIIKQIYNQIYIK